jgi:hypothetical protein
MTLPGSRVATIAVMHNTAPLLHRMSPKLALRVTSRQRSISVALGAKRTLTRARGLVPVTSAIDGSAER